MGLTENNLENLIVVGDKALIKPCSNKTKTKSGLFLPPDILKKPNFKMDML
jgi:hypothetical protein